MECVQELAHQVVLQVEVHQEEAHLEDLGEDATEDKKTRTQHRISCTHLYLP